MVESTHVEQERRKQQEKIVALRALVSGSLGLVRSLSDAGDGKQCANCERLCGHANVIDSQEGYYCNGCFLYYRLVQASIHLIGRIHGKQRSRDEITADEQKPEESKPAGSCSSCRD